VNDRPHQGVIADVSALEPVSINHLDVSMIKTRKIVALALDMIQDPQNFGAIVRTAYFFGISHLVVWMDVYIVLLIFPDRYAKTVAALYRLQPAKHQQER